MTPNAPSFHRLFGPLFLSPADAGISQSCTLSSPTHLLRHSFSLPQLQSTSVLMTFQSVGPVFFSFVANPCTYASLRSPVSCPTVTSSSTWQPPRCLFFPSHQNLLKFYLNVPQMGPTVLFPLSPPLFLITACPPSYSVLYLFLLHFRQ